MIIQLFIARNPVENGRRQLIRVGLGDPRLSILTPHNWVITRDMIGTVEGVLVGRFVKVARRVLNLRDSKIESNKQNNRSNMVAGVGGMQIYTI